MRIVVTGASGFLGKHVVRHLRSSGAEVMAVARRNCEDCLRVADYSGAPEGDVLIHLGQDSDRGRVNGLGELAIEESRRTLKGLLAKGYDKIVYASSAVLYGDASLGLRVTTDPVFERDAYSRLKRESEFTVLNSPQGSVVRLANLYGPGMSTNNVLSAILGQIPGQGELRVMDDTPVRDFLWVEDAAAVLCEIAVSTSSGLFNAGSGIGISINELARLCLELASESHRSVVATQRSDRASSLILDIFPTLKLGWKPTVELPDGIKCLLNEKTQ